MQIDWFTFGAQIINFLILVALLRLFLYKPIIEVMNEREQKITARLEEAQRKKENAEAEAEEYHSKQHELEARRDDLLAEARDAADKQRQKLIEQARAEVDDMRDEWRRTVQREKEMFLRRLRERVSDDVFALTRCALRDLADADLEQQLMNRFVHEIETLEGDVRDAISRDLDQAVEIHSAFNLSESQQKRLREIIHERFGALDVRFVIDSELVCGVALVTDSAHIGWNIHDYLGTLQEHIKDLLAEQALPEKTTADEDAVRQTAGSAARQGVREMAQEE